MSDPLIDKKLGEYKIISLLGQGGMARVYKGYDERLERFSAVKVIEANQLVGEDEEEYRERFVREARAIAKLHHPNIVSVYQFGELGHIYYMAMSFVEGRDLRQILKEYEKQKKYLSHAQILRIIQDIASALDYSHEQGVIHRDVKPSNIMVTISGGQSVLTDFGLALRAQEGTMGNTFGSVHYIAPEQAVSSAQAVPQSDLYSLGVVLYEMLTGRVPFEDVSAMSVALKHISDPPPPASSLNSAISSQVEEVLAKVLDKDPQRRFATGRAFIHALETAFAASEDEDTHETEFLDTPLSKLALEPEQRQRIMAAQQISTAEGDSWDSFDNSDDSDQERSRPILLTALEAKTEHGTKSRRKNPISSVNSDSTRESAKAARAGLRRRFGGLAVILVLVAILIGGGIIASGMFSADDGDENIATPTSAVVAVATDDMDDNESDDGVVITQAVVETADATSSPSTTATSQPSPTTPPTATPEATTVASVTEPADDGDAPDEAAFVADAVNEDEPSLLLYYTPDQFIIYDRSISTVPRIDVRRLTFVNQTSEQTFNRSDWSYTGARWRIRPQLDCFQIVGVLTTDAPSPEFCNFLQAFEQTRSTFWLGETTFDVMWDSEVIATCSAVSESGDETVCFVDAAFP